LNGSDSSAAQGSPRKHSRRPGHGSAHGRRGLVSPEQALPGRTMAPATAPTTSRSPSHSMNRPVSRAAGIRPRPAGSALARTFL